MVERHPYKVDVAGSNPVLPTNQTTAQVVFLFLASAIGEKAEVRKRSEEDIKKVSIAYHQKHSDLCQFADQGTELALRCEEAAQVILR